MSKPTDFQQQILFEEKEIDAGENKSLPIEQQVIVDNDEWQAEEVADDSAFAEECTQSAQSNNVVWRLLTFIVLLVVTLELADFFVTGFTEAPITTSLYAGLLGLVGFLAGASLVREFVGLKQLKQRDQIREELAKLLESDAHGNAEKVVTKLTKSLSNDLSAAQQQKWEKSLAEHFSDKEVVELYSRQVLSETDEKALAAVARFSSESVVLVALSPVAVLDMLIMLWRNLALVDKIAGLYGLKLGYWSRIKLVKQVIFNMIFAGASEVVADVSADMLGADMLGKLSGRLAQGLGAGMLTARLGLKTIYLCRPIPFDDNAPKLSQVRREIVGQIKQLMKPTAEK
ncbi:YcjF family protein [Thalassotalea euphylliae]|uniref:YcjF family protein n=1 Tax=Thalassotalea euphylliae TaxID=1655234 RepID=UPI0036277573